ALVVILVLVGNLMMRGRMQPRRLELESLNERFEGYADAMQEVVGSDPKAIKKAQKARAKEDKQRRKTGSTQDRVFVLEFEGDIRGSALDQLRDEITAVLTVAQPSDEV